MDKQPESKSLKKIWSFGPESSIVHVVVEDSVMSTIDRWRQHDLYKQSEACGILLGERRGNSLRVTHATEPYKTDQRTPTYYQRNTSGHQDVVNYLHQQSHGAIQYLGEWHTHPQLEATPSSTDYQEWARTTQLSRFRYTQLIFFIAGIKSDWLGSIDNQVLSFGKLN
ncbi:Mov34/MPN/PAD-1 family protein [Agitococcus lubricus]|uniref:Integrative and conjugative element protein (TIGR02256 family) n=1 Tax=Agitococcus lubricus TaxID=1077255 RepID=A0A2T5ISI4_9GAMM|nr:Mov34/MPN/PAD-1 family protein [Agitococcus lubricus]PTQ86790.1 integrative and conjugative element protein (TIGR02256 family) [Agitococcus lubricus]